MQSGEAGVFAPDSPLHGFYSLLTKCVGIGFYGWAVRIEVVCAILDQSVQAESDNAIAIINARRAFI
jgi:hypothetical protein